MSRHGVLASRSPFASFGGIGDIYSIAKRRDVQSMGSGTRQRDNASELGAQHLWLSTIEVLYSQQEVAFHAY